MNHTFSKCLFFIFIFYIVYPLYSESLSALEIQSTDNQAYTIQKDVFSNSGISWKTSTFTLYGTLGQPTPIRPLQDIDINNFSGFFHPRKKQIPGYAIIAVGSVEGQEGLDSHTKTAENIYLHLINRGFAFGDKSDPMDLIKYFNPMDDAGLLYRDIYEESRESNYKTALEDTITNWSFSKLEYTAAPLYIILINHGYRDKFYLTNNQVLEAFDLNEWINDLEDKMTQAGISQPILIFMGSCYSGSFIDELSQSNKNRIIVTSTSPDEVSYRGAVISDEHYRLRDGDFFLSALFSELGQGLDLKTSFQNARIRTTIHTDNGKDLEKIYPYFNSAMQHPLLDDNGDGSGSYYLSVDGDGDIAENIILGWNDTKNLEITSIGCDDDDRVFMDQPLQVWANVSDKARTKKVWIEIRKSNIFLINGEIQQTIDLDYKSLSYSELSGRYEATIEASYFDRPGKYTLFFYVKEDNDIVLPTQWLFVYKPKDNNLPPSHFSLKSPENESTVRTSTILSWESAYDTDRLSYSIFLYKKEPPDMIEKHGIEESMYPIDLPETWDKYKIYWYVRAIDEFGAYTDTDIWTFNTDNTGANDANIVIRLYNSLTGNMIKSASVMLENNYYLDTSEGYYWGTFPEGTYQMTAFDGCHETKFFTVTLQVKKIKETLEKSNNPKLIELIPKWNYDEMDINRDGKIDLTDIIVFMKILSGDFTATEFYQNLNISENESFQLFLCTMKQLCGF
jgi:hypothetical protein